MRPWVPGGQKRGAVGRQPPVSHVTQLEERERAGAYSLFLFPPIPLLLSGLLVQEKKDETIPCSLQPVRVIPCVNIPKLSMSPRDCR